MKVFLLHPDRALDVQSAPPAQAEDLIHDLALETLLASMAAGDRFVHDVSRVVLLAAVDGDAATIRYRQEVVADCLAHPEMARELYEIAVEALDRKRRQYLGVLSRYPGGILSGAVELLGAYSELLRAVRDTADAYRERVRSRGFTRLFTVLQEELDDEYLAALEEHVANLRLPHGVLLRAQPGTHNESTGLVLLRPPRDGPNLLQRLLGRTRNGYTVHVDPRDEAGMRALGELRDRGIDAAANAAGQAADHVLAFFETLRTELAFLVGCVNLHETLASFGASLCFPEPAEPSSLALRCEQLYDVTLALQMQRAIVPSSVDATGKGVMIITGANQGGKSSFLRALGIAHLMLHAGMFVGATRLVAEPRDGVFTLYRREEDVTMTHGKLDEELARMSAITDLLRPGALMLVNEAFAATNEREGSELASQVVDALMERGIRVIYVTHLHAFAHDMYVRHSQDGSFLRAERLPDGARTFRLIPGEPLETSFGLDLYERIFGERDAGGDGQRLSSRPDR
jgi:hypothetical protein